MTLAISFHILHFVSQSLGSFGISRFLCLLKRNTPDTIFLIWGYGYLADFFLRSLWCPYVFFLIPREKDDISIASGPLDLRVPYFAILQLSEHQSHPSTFLLASLGPVWLEKSWWQWWKLAMLLGDIGGFGVVMCIKMLGLPLWGPPLYCFSNWNWRFLVCVFWILECSIFSYGA